MLNSVYCYRSTASMNLLLQGLLLTLYIQQELSLICLSDHLFIVRFLKKLIALSILYFFLTFVL